MKAHRNIFYLILFLGIGISTSVKAQLKVFFPAKDELMITANWYPVSSDYPVILLCHQNGYSRGEYAETALRLNKFDFNCLAIDQRVGKTVNGVLNETAADAEEKKKSQSFEDAEQDILAALDYLQTQYKQKVIILGSSYSASLALKIAASSDRVSAVVAFSPGEYFSDPHYISSSIEKLDKPVFITSSRKEADGVTQLVRDVNSKIKIQYIPKQEGDHGSKVLWSTSPQNQEYWIALMSFLNKVKKIH
jgi:dienelactone hydrolase